jgi:hypothetical protein
MTTVMDPTDLDTFAPVDDGCSVVFEVEGVSLVCELPADHDGMHEVSLRWE